MILKWFDNIIGTYRENVSERKSAEDEKKTHTILRSYMKLFNIKCMRLLPQLWFSPEWK